MKRRSTRVSPPSDYIHPSNNLNAVGYYRVTHKRRVLFLQCFGPSARERTEAYTASSTFLDQLDARLVRYVAADLSCYDSSGIEIVESRGGVDTAAVLSIARGQA